MFVEELGGQGHHESSALLYGISLVDFFSQADKSLRVRAFQQLVVDTFCHLSHHVEVALPLLHRGIFFFAFVLTISSISRSKCVMRNSIPRECYLPENVREVSPFVPEGTDLAIWSWENDGKFYAIAFQGKKSQKPLWNYRFRNEAHRSERIEGTASSRREALARKAAERVARNSFKHGLEVGDFLVAAWGYDQTNVDFYEVVGTKGKSVTLRQVRSRVAKETGHSEYVEPVAGAFCSEPFNRRPGVYGVKIDNVSRARKWDGKPRYQTAFGWGH